MKSKSKIIFIVSLILIIILSGSYAYLSIIRKESDTYTFSTGCLNITLNKANNFLNVEKAIPITDIEGLKEVGYTFSIENKCNNKSKYEINLESLNSNTISDDYIKVSLSSNTFDNIISKLISNKERDHILEDTNKSYNIYTGELNENEIKTFTLKEWLDYDTPNIGALTFQNKLNVISNPEIEVAESDIKINIEDTKATITTTHSNLTYCIGRANKCDDYTILENNEIPLTDEGKKIICIKENNLEVCNIGGTYEGLGTEDNPYKIEYIDDLVTLSNKTNAGNSYEGAYFELTRNIDFQKEVYYQDKTLKDRLTSGSGFTSIGNEANHFKGNFNGNNYRIDNLYINNLLLGNIIGLFGVIENGSAQNLTLSGLVNTTVTADVGALAGRLNNSTIKNIHNEAKVNSETIEWSTGGLVGSTWNKVNIIDCSNSGEISNGTYTGGLVGGLGNLTEILIENSYNEGEVSKNISNDILTHGTAGLIGGDNGYATSITIKKSYNTGNISEKLGETYSVIGGLIGKTYTSTIIENCYNSGEIKNNNLELNANFDQDVGGLIGVVQSGEKYTIIKNSYNTGKVLNGNYTGGLVGYNCYSNIIIDRSYNAGEISSSITFKLDTLYGVMMGGLIGNNVLGTTNQTYIFNSYNLGDINNGNNLISANYGGGLIGTNAYNKTTIINSYNIGNITRTGDASERNIYGGIVSANDAENTALYLNNVYNIGKITNDKPTTTGECKYNISYIGPESTSAITNVYYQEGLPASNQTINATALAENQLLNKEQYNNKLFVDILNENISNIDLSSITQELQTTGLLENTETLSLSKWIIGPNGYPIFEYQK